MKKRISDNKSTDITAEACAWIAQIESGRLTSADREALREWIGRSHKHAAVIKQMARLSMDLNVLTELTLPGDSRRNDAPAAAASGLHGWAPKGWGLALLAVAVSALVLVVTIRNIEPLEQPVVLSTPIGGYQEAELADGTLVKLNTNSQLEVHYSNQVRKVRLLSGEAYFDVAHDPDKPFIVYVDKNYVRAIGTAFLVRFSGESFSVSVVEGKVELAEASSLQQPPTIDKAVNTPKEEPEKILNTLPLPLAAGERANVSRQNKEVVTVSSRELQRELAWQEGLLDFADTPLEEVVNELGRYSSLNVEFIDSELRGIKFGGIFRKEDPQSLFDALQHAYGIDVQYLDGDIVRLSLASKYNP
ncbi:MAG: FecR domain-containing protein [Porticoccaceae bacterium]